MHHGIRAMTLEFPESRGYEEADITGQGLAFNSKFANANDTLKEWSAPHPDEGIQQLLVVGGQEVPDSFQRRKIPVHP
jgi:hypothetical protein